MSFIDRLRRSTPDYFDEDAAQKYREVYSDPVLEDYILFHSAVHPRAEVEALIETFVSSMAKIGKDDKTFVYSQHPAYIAQFVIDLTPSAEQHRGILVRLMVYSNCLIAYYEPIVDDVENTGHVYDVCIHVHKDDWEVLQHGSKK